MSENVILSKRTMEKIAVSEKRETGRVSARIPPGWGRENKKRFYNAREITAYLFIRVLHIYIYILFRYREL